MPLRGLSDQVHFEVRGFDAAVRLTRRLGAWAGELLLSEPEPYVVAALIGSEPDALADLLREVDSSLEEESLAAVRFLLDHRLYTLRDRGSQAGVRTL